MTQIKEKKTYVVKPTELRKSLKANLTKAINGGRIFIDTKDGDAVLLSLADFNELSAYKETAYLLSTEANRKHLRESIAQSKRGETTTIRLEDLWK